MKNRLKKVTIKRPSLRLRKLGLEKSLEQAIQNLPRITNETVAEHREEVLASARKYIYPLKHSAHRIVTVSASLSVFLLVVFFMSCAAALYRFQANGTFIHRVTQVVPFPVARAGNRFVTYEDYLFELRHYMHYYQTQEKVDFSDESGKQQLADFRKRALDIVVNDAYTKELAEAHNISVSAQEVDNLISLLRDQNRLGSSDQVFADVLKEYWGWSVADFKRELKQQILAQKVVANLDTETQARANAAYARVKDNEDFATLAQQLSDDKGTAANGGQYGFDIDKSTRDLSPQVIDELFKLQPGQISGLVNTSTGLEILRVNSVNGTKLRASHIVLNFKSIDQYLVPIREKQKPSTFIHPQ